MAEELYSTLRWYMVIVGCIGMALMVLGAVVLT